MTKIFERIRKIKIDSPTELLKKVVAHFDKTDLAICVAVFVVGIINNFYFFVTDGLQADALSFAHFKVAGLWETQLGRPLIQVVDRLRFGFVNQFLIVLVCLGLITGAMMLIRRAFRVKNTLLMVLLSVVVCVAPQFTETYEFLYCADSYLLAFFCSALVVYAISRVDGAKDKKQRVLWLALVILCTAVICGLYQAYLGCVVGLTILYAIYEVLTRGSVAMSVKSFARNILCVVAGVCIYYVLLLAYCKLLGTNLATYKGASSLGLETFLSLPHSILHCYADFLKFFFTDDIIYNKYYHRNIIYAVFFLALILGLVTTIWKNKTKRVARTIVTIFLVAIFPVGVNVMNLVAPTTRINLVTGPGLITTFILAAIVFNSHIGQKKEQNSQTLLRWVNFAALIALSWTLIVSNTFTYIYRQRQYDNLETIMQDVYSRVVTLDNYDDELPWMFSNIIQVKVNDLNRTNGMVARNMITWQNFNGTRQYASFIYKYKGIKITTVDADKYREIVRTDTFRGMPAYPAKGSIAIINSVVVIKVAERTF